MFRHPPNPPRSRLRAGWAPPLAVLLGLVVFATPAQASCIDEDAAEPPPAAAEGAAPPPPEPRRVLASLVHDALERSQAVGAARLLAEAAQSDIEEARAGHAVQVSVGAGIGPGGSRTNGINENADAQLRANLSISQLLWDGGRIDRLVDWRAQLAESARWGHLSQQEQLAATAVALQLERSRHRMTAQVYRSQVRTTDCLVQALESIVRTDRGRASELVQARKSLQQVELSLAQTLSVQRQVDVRLRRLVGDGLPPTEGLSVVFNGLPDVQQLVLDAELSAEVSQLSAQAAAAGRYAEAVAAGGKPQLSWNVTANAAAGRGGTQGTTRSGAYALGLAVNVPLYSAALAPAGEAARKRAEAAALQRGEALQARRFRVVEVHEQASASVDRARRVAEVLRNSEQVRNFTLQQWQQLGRRSLFDVMAAENDHYAMRVAYVNALHDVQLLNANLLSLGGGVLAWLR